MKTKLTDAEREVGDKLNTQLLCDCHDLIGQANAWRLMAHEAILRKVSLDEFVSGQHPRNKARAKSAYVLAAWEVLQ